MFPETRMRRLRKNKKIRDLVRETELSVKDLICPIFVDENLSSNKEITSMPGQYRIAPNNVVDEAKEILDLGITAVILFGIPKEKDEVGSSAFGSEDVVQMAVHAIKDEFGEDLIVITDVCLCEYTTHGHCGIVSKNKEILNDPTLEILGKVAISHAQAGADIVAPSGMMDGMIKSIRGALDSSGFKDTIIMSYAAKYSSVFYGPFRDAADSVYSFGDRSTYQIDPANADEALLEVKLDLEEGADIIMVKPAISYLDIIYRVKQTFKRPTAAYNVSGEYSMIKAASKLGWLDEKKVMYETLISIKRAGADMILTYFAKDIARVL